MSPPKELLVTHMKAATFILEDAAREWQEEWPDAKPACFLMSAAKFIADSFSGVSDDGFEAMLNEMRIERKAHQVRKQS